MYEFWHDYLKAKSFENPKLYYMDTDSFIVDIKTNDIYKVIKKSVEIPFDTSKYELDRLLPTKKKKKKQLE